MAATSDWLRFDRQSLCCRDGGITAGWSGSRGTNNHPKAREHGRRSSGEQPCRSGRQQIGSLIRMGQRACCICWGQSGRRPETFRKSSSVRRGPPLRSARSPCRDLHGYCRPSPGPLRAFPWEQGCREASGAVRRRPRRDRSWHATLRGPSRTQPRTAQTSVTLPFRELTVMAKPSGAVGSSLTVDRTLRRVRSIPSSLVNIRFLPTAPLIFEPPGRN